MARAAVIQTDLLAEDLAAIRLALLIAGRDPAEDVPWLLAQGLHHYTRDEAEWEAWNERAEGEAQARLQELKRREADALLVSMRASTVAAEILAHELGKQVQGLGATLEAYRREMRRLREENAALEAHLRGAEGFPDTPLSGQKHRPTLAQRLRALFANPGELRRRA